VSLSVITVSLAGSLYSLLVRHFPLGGSFPILVDDHAIGAFVILGDLYVPETQTWNLSGTHIARQQDFWFTIGMTVV